jgi:hypothetical protein
VDGPCSRLNALGLKSKFSGGGGWGRFSCGGDVTGGEEVAGGASGQFGLVGSGVGGVPPKSRAEEASEARGLGLGAGRGAEKSSWRKSSSSLPHLGCRKRGAGWRDACSRRWEGGEEEGRRASGGDRACAFAVAVGVDLPVGATPYSSGLGRWTFLPGNGRPVALPDLCGWGAAYGGDGRGAGAGCTGDSIISSTL